MRARYISSQLVSALVLSSVLAVLAAGCTAIEPGEDTAPTAPGVEAAALPGAPDVAAASLNESGDITLQEVLESGVEDIGATPSTFPPPGSGDCTCDYRWECRDNQCGGDGRAFRLKCCTCTGGFGCDTNWEATNICC